MESKAVSMLSRYNVTMLYRIMMRNYGTPSFKPLPKDTSSEAPHSNGNETEEQQARGTKADPQDPKLVEIAKNMISQVFDNQETPFDKRQQGPPFDKKR